MPGSKKMILIAALAAACMAALGWSAGAGLAPEPTPVATVDINRVFLGLDENTVRETKVRDELTTMRSEIQRLATEYKALEDGIGAMKSPGNTELITAQSQLFMLGKTIQSKQELLQATMSLKVAILRRELADKIYASIKAVAERDGWRLVLADDSSFGLPDPLGMNAGRAVEEMEREILRQRVYYRDPRVDITDTVVTYMNNQFKADGGQP